MEQKQKLFSKILLLMVLLAFVIAMLISAFTIVEQTRFTKKALIEKNKLIAEIASQSIQAGYYSDRMPFETLKEISRSDDVVFLWVVRSDGKIYYADNVALWGKKIKEEFSDTNEITIIDSIFSETGETIKLIIHPLNIGKANEKWKFYLGVSLKSIKDNRDEILVTGFIFFAISIIFAILLSYYFARTITKPISKLVKATEEFAQGNFGYKVKIKTKDELKLLAESFNKTGDELIKAQAAEKEYSQKLEKEVVAKTRKLKSLLSKTQEDKGNLEKQRAATLNILDDVQQSQAELEVANKATEKRSHELEVLKTLGDELTKVLNIEKAVQVVNKHLAEVLKFSAVTYLVINPAEEGGLIYQAFLKEEVSEFFVDEAEKDLLKFLSREKDDKMKAVLKVVKNIKPQLFGQKLNNKSTARPKAKVILPLSIGTRKLGVIFITSAKSGLSNIKKGGLIDAMVLTFVLAIDRLHTLVSAQHSKTVSLVESLSDGVVMFNNEGEIVLKNPAFIRYTGLTIKDFSLDDFYKLFAGIDVGRIVNEALTLGKISHIHEVAVGEKFYEIFITPVKDNQVKIVGGAIILHDITHLKEIDRMKTEFVSVASHQLRTPLTAIKLFTGMLVRGEVGELNKEQKEYLDNIQQSIERMVRLVNDLLNVTRIESGKLRVEPQLLDVVSFIKNIIAEVKPLAETKKQKILFKQDSAVLPKIPLDQNLMRQVIYNLVINAIRYSPQDKGEIIVSLEKKDKDNFIIAIKDNGIGIPKEGQKRVFEKFYRADNAIKVLTEGTGLGLYVAKKIVESAKGKIWFNSKKNKGSTFFVQMPIAGMRKKKGERGLAIS